jgi:hypothetical protein
METSTGKIKILAFQSTESIPSKLCTENRIPHSVNKFSYLDFTLPYQGEADTYNKIVENKSTVRVINNVVEPCLVQRHTQKHLYKTSGLNNDMPYRQGMDNNKTEYQQQNSL